MNNKNDIQMAETEKNENQSLLRQQAILARFGELALRSDDLSQILTEACRLVGDALGTELAKVVKVQEDGKQLLVVAGVGWKPGVIGVTTIPLNDDTSESKALKTGEPMISPDVETETRFTYPPFLKDNGVRAVANVLIIGGKDRPPFGVLQVDSRKPRNFTENDVTFLRGYANLIAAAVDRLRILEDLRERDSQLHQAQKLEAIGRLAAGVAHDFNNILQSVSGGLEMILEGSAADPTVHEFAQIALTSVQRGSYLTQHLLSYARKQMLQPREVEVDQFLLQLRELLLRTLGPHIAISVSPSRSVSTINVDPGQLQTALLNLAINASHAMPAKGTLRLEACEGGSGADRYVIIEVTDSGIGMDEATLTHAFEPFFTTKGPNGSGLGLSMVQGFAEQSGGRVSIDSSPGRGTKIRMWLPAAQQVGMSHKQQSATSKLHGSGRILLVDDAPDVLAITGVLLCRAGFQVVQAKSGFEALAVFAAGERFDALVTDYAMPGMNGLELINQASAVQPGVAALIITGFAQRGEPDAMPNNVSILHKPFRQRQLIQAVTRSIEKNDNLVTSGEQDAHRGHHPPTAIAKYRDFDGRDSAFDPEGRDASLV